MIRYICKNCKIETKESVCSECGERTEGKSIIYWCENCNVPVYSEVCLCGNKAKELTKDVRPVFPEERLLIEIVLGEPFKFLQSSVWNGAGNIYYVNGKKISFSISGLKKVDADYVHREYERLSPMNNYDAFNRYRELFVKNNAYRFHEIDSEATAYIKNRTKDVSLSDMMVSFSGGKDSTVTSDLVMRAMNTVKVAHIFGDTTLEFPMTYEYVKEFKRIHPQTIVMPAKNSDKDFLELCKVIGPPSRVMRWCCTVFKTGAITRKIESMFRGKSHILTFYGIRRSESASRSKYDKEASSPKITKQTVISPIIDWFDFDVWLYILTRDILFNGAYRLGYSRVGCWCCPNNSTWSEFLSRVHMNEKYHEFRNLLIDFAASIGKEDAQEYVDSGNWKARQGGNGVEYAKKSVVSFTPCATEENTYNYELSKPITEELYELFKPFGYRSNHLGNPRLNEVFFVNRAGEILLKLQGRIGSTQLKVSIYSKKITEEKVKCQITKYQMCIGCKACVSLCRHDAIKIVEKGGNEVSYTIDDNRCVRCRECVNHFNSGCYMRKVLAVKRGQ